MSRSLLHYLLSAAKQKDGGGIGVKLNGGDKFLKTFINGKKRGGGKINGCYSKFLLPVLLSKEKQGKANTERDTNQ